MWVKFVPNQDEVVVGNQDIDIRCGTAIECLAQCGWIGRYMPKLSREALAPKAVNEMVAFARNSEVHDFKPEGKNTTNKKYPQALLPATIADSWRERPCDVLTDEMWQELQTDAMWSQQYPTLSRLELVSEHHIGTYYNTTLVAMMNGVYKAQAEASEARANVSDEEQGSNEPDKTGTQSSAHSSSDVDDPPADQEVYLDVGATGILYDHFLPDYAMVKGIKKENRCPGDLKCSWKFRSAWHSIKADDQRSSRRTEFRKVLSQEWHYMKEAKTRYGFLLTDLELVVVHAKKPREEGSFEVPIPEISPPIYWTHEYEQIPATKAQMKTWTIPLALWWLMKMCALGEDWQAEYEEHEEEEDHEDEDD
ncbi:hypothetical protein EWM64_g5360 [Hericium alpestre]|uniref:Uncharacterized protein n=1 Tax=Hericium alpestre TaxID=135208 RepID=A0A4Y9ZWW1_9AGAM|nr:hypothetical protein EWM64_g5360 [Hericium alpestre]